MSYVLAVDIGSSSFRISAVDFNGVTFKRAQVPFLSEQVSLGTVDFDALKLCQNVISLANEFAKEVGRPALISITNQRATTVIWEKSNSLPITNALGWQDLRNLSICLELKAQGISIMPNASATKIRWILNQVDPKITKNLRFGTLDSYLIWLLTSGKLHVTDPSNAGATALLNSEGNGWNQELLQILEIPVEIMPEIVPSTQIISEDCIVSKNTKVGGILGDQQASMFGQGVTAPGLAKATFGTGGMCDTVTKDLKFSQQGPNGTFPIVAFSTSQDIKFGLEAMALSAGSVLNWLKDDLNLITAFDEVDYLAKNSNSQEDLFFVPALFGLGSPYWDFGARASFVGLNASCTKADLVRAVLEGVAHTGADLIDALEKDAQINISEIRVDGGMSQSDYFLQALADCSQKKVCASADKEATTIGIAALGLVALKQWDLSDVVSKYQPRQVFVPQRKIDRSKWFDAVNKARGVIPELSELKF
jgi:glycerol kinase